MIVKLKTGSTAKSEYMRAAKIELAKFERNELALQKEDRLLRARQKKLPLNTLSLQKS